MRRLEGKTAIVTGAGRGLGEATARLFAQEGANAVVVDLDAALVDSVVSSVRAAGGKALGVVADVSDAEQVRFMVEQTVSEFESVDVLVNNAGIFGQGVPVADIDEDYWNKVLQVNLTGPFLCSKYVLPLMSSSGGGSIVCVSSVSGVIAHANQADYNVSKHGLIGLVRCMAQDYGLQNIRVNAVCPTVIKTPMLSKNRPDNLAVYRGQTALGRFAEPEEIASIILFLASDESAFMTGAVVMADAGVTALQASAASIIEGLKSLERAGS